ncbi:unnamed protein product [Cylicostephanus goldi]|uniref:Integrin alpha-2 domain-containing protein n=1 Tax=Cylicostephanus goldi TaxID=71465 RepID=A0A3P6TXM1_CYLGO|nr:unnamed protein product [Cylicostephanus goldi]
MTFTEDRFLINGTKLGSAFGYAVEVVDLNNDGFDDLVIGAPFEHRSDSDGHFGGVVYVYFSQGVERKKFESHKVFHSPIILKGPEPFSQFGLAISKLGNVDGDKDGFNGIVYRTSLLVLHSPMKELEQSMFSLAANRKRTSEKLLLRYTLVSLVIVDIILGSDLPNVRRPLKSFGFSLSGGSDLDGNGYPDLVVGAVTKGVVTILRYVITC